MLFQHVRNIYGYTDRPFKCLLSLYYLGGFIFCQQKMSAQTGVEKGARTRAVTTIPLPRIHTESIFLKLILDIIRYILQDYLLNRLR